MDRWRMRFHYRRTYRLEDRFRFYPQAELLEVASTLRGLELTGSQFREQALVQ